MGKVDDVDGKAIKDMLKQSADAYVARDWDGFASIFPLLLRDTASM